jgi:hypothetical protein
MILGTPVSRRLRFVCSRLNESHASAFSIPTLGGDPDFVPALVLVLFPSGCLHHDPAVDGCRSVS